MDGMIMLGKKSAGDDAMIPDEEFKLEDTFVEKKALNLISYHEALKNRVLPVSVKNGVFCIATSNMTKNLLIEKINEKYSFRIKIYPCEEEELLQKIEREYRLEDQVQEYESIKENLSDSNFFDEMLNISVGRLLDEIINQAIAFGASDIHIEPMEENSRIRFRIDGALKNIDYKNHKTHREMIGRIKILSKLNIAETKRPQDGRISHDADGEDYDLRISIIPTVYGEKAVVRVLNGKSFGFEMKDIGFEQEHIKKLRRAVESGNGMILICGPTGSGKTTTLYSILNEVSNEKKNIVSIEDPPEYIIEGMSQMQVREKRGVDFANGLRAILRQDPDIIMIGEIRDEITANIAIKAASTGHLILSSVHTARAVDSISRMLNMKVKPYQLVEALKIVVAQRLVLKICENCKAGYFASEAEKRELDVDVEKDLILYRGSGCCECFHSGYKGRCVVYEFLEIDDYMRSKIKKDLKLNQIYSYQKSRKFKTYEENTRKLVMHGVTSIDEYRKVST